MKKNNKLSQILWILLCTMLCVMVFHKLCTKNINKQFNIKPEKIIQNENNNENDKERENKEETITPELDKSQNIEKNNIKKEDIKKVNENNQTPTKSSLDITKDTKAQREELAKIEAKKVINKIITPDMNKLQKAEAIFKYLHSTVETQHNQSNEAYKTNHGDEAYGALILKKAACSGVANAVTLLCNEIGLKSQHINKNKWKHQWNKVLIDDNSFPEENEHWIVLDAQGGFFGDQHPFEDLDENT